MSLDTRGAGAWALGCQAGLSPLHRDSQMFRMLPAGIEVGVFMKRTRSVRCVLGLYSVEDEHGVGGRSGGQEG